MKLFSRFIWQEAGKIFFILLLIFLAFYLVMDFFERLPSFLTAKKPLLFFLKYLLWKIQLNIFQIYPYVVGLSGIVTLIILSRSQELLALICLGIKQKEILSKLANLLLFMTLFGSLILIIISPKAYYEAHKTWDIDIEERKVQHLIFKGEFFFEGENFLLIAKPLEPKGEYLKDLTLIYLEEDQPSKVLWAEYAIYREKTWHLERVVLQDRSQEFKPIFMERFSETLPFKPKTFVLVEKPIKYLSLKELYQRWLFLRKVDKPQKEIFAEFINRIMYLFSGYLLGLIPIFVFLKYYSPHNFKSAVIKGFFSFFFLSFLYLLSQTLSPAYPLASLIIFLITLLVNFHTHFLIRGNSSHLSGAKKVW